MIDLVFKQGKHFSVFPFRVIWLQDNKHETLQVAVGVSSRNFKRAVDRNRIKRLMREAYRLQKASLDNALALQPESTKWSVFILYTGKEIPGYDMVYEKFGTIIKRLIKITHEQPEADT